jgi:hypothetical protein
MNSTDWIGFIGVFQILLGFILNISGTLKKNNLIFILLNLVGASMACYASILLDYLPFIVLEGVWALVAIIALINYIKWPQKQT